MEIYLVPTPLIIICFQNVGGKEVSAREAKQWKHNLLLPIFPCLKGHGIYPVIDLKIDIHHSSIELHKSFFKAKFFLNCSFVCPCRLVLSGNWGRLELSFWYKAIEDHSFIQQFGTFWKVKQLYDNYRQVSIKTK